MKKQRPVNLDLNTISFPPSAISSILHRVTGVAMFFALMFVIGAWMISLNGESGFQYAQELMGSVLGKIITIGTVSALTYHILGGVRHMLMDMGYFEELDSGNNSAKAIIGLWIILTVVEAIVLW